MGAPPRARERPRVGARARDAAPHDHAPPLGPVRSSTWKTTRKRRSTARTDTPRCTRRRSMATTMRCVVLLKHGANPRARDGKYRGTPAGWAAICRSRGDGESDPRRRRRHLRRDRLRSRRPCARHSRSRSRRDRSAVQGLRVVRAAGESVVAGGGLHAARMGDRAAEAESRRCVDRTRRWIANERRHSARRAHRLFPAVGLLGSPRARQAGSSDARPRGAAPARAGSVDVARQICYTAIVCGERERLTRLLARDPKPHASARRRTRMDADSVPRLHAVHARADDRAMRSRSRRCFSTTARTRTTSTWPATRSTPCSSASPAKANRSRRGSRTRPRLFELMLARGAEPFDIQVLYNTHFSGDILWWLELVYAHAIHTPTRSERGRIPTGRCSTWAATDRARAF